MAFDECWVTFKHSATHLGVGKVSLGRCVETAGSMGEDEPRIRPAYEAG